MSKVRVVMAEMEGTDSAVLDAIRSFVLAKMGGTETAAVVAIEGANGNGAQVVKALPAGEAPNGNGQVARKKYVRRKKETLPDGRGSEMPPVREGSTRQMVMAALKKRPMTSAELIRELKLTPPQVYTTLTEFRKAMVIETRADGDGTRKNFVKG